MQVTHQSTRKLDPDGNEAPVREHYHRGCIAYGAQRRGDARGVVRLSSVGQGPHLAVSVWVRFRIRIDMHYNFETAIVPPPPLPLPRASRETPTQKLARTQWTAKMTKGDAHGGVRVPKQLALPGLNAHAILTLTSPAAALCTRARRCTLLPCRPGNCRSGVHGTRTSPTRCWSSKPTCMCTATVTLYQCLHPRCPPTRY